MDKLSMLIIELSVRMRRVERQLLMNKEHLSVEEAALYMDCSESEILRLVKGTNPVISSTQPSKKKRYILRTELEAYMGSEM